MGSKKTYHQNVPTHQDANYRPSPPDRGPLPPMSTLPGRDFCYTLPSTNILPELSTQHRGRGHKVGLLENQSLSENLHCREHKEGAEHFIKRHYTKNKRKKRRKKKSLYKNTVFPNPVTCFKAVLHFNQLTINNF